MHIVFMRAKFETHIAHDAYFLRVLRHSSSWCDVDMNLNLKFINKNF